ncbi:MAG TPA: hypothetical protein VFZ34_10695 [Blastocatellia bacterium]|nr:hypothetical protein [Blastocatellia bacterium]
MKKPILFLFTLTLFSALAFAQPRPLRKIQQARQNRQEAQANAAGTKSFTLQLEGVNREFVIYRPAKVPANQKTPVVFAFHGTGGNGPQFMRDSGWMDVADREGLTIVSGSSMRYHIYQDELYSRGEVIENSQQYAWKWNFFRLSDLLDPKYPNQKLYDDVKFTLAMIDTVKKDYAVDETRFYATGFSNGAQMASRLAVQLSHIFAAYGICAIGNPFNAEEMARTNEYTNKPFTPRPVMHVLGELDGKVNHAAGTTSFPLDESAVADGTYIKGRIITPWGMLLKLEDKYEYKRTNKGAWFRYSQSQAAGAKHEFVFTVAQGMGHTYQNGGKPGFKVADWFWSFMSKFKR